MCLIIFKSSKSDLPKNHLENAYKNNSDGCGYAFIRNDKIIIKKGFFTFDSFFQSYSKDIKRTSGSPFLIHFRIKTVGEKNVNNCQPFLAEESYALTHNGTFNLSGFEIPDKWKNYSDSRIFSKMLKGLYYQIFNVDNSGINFLLSEYITDEKCKVVILSSDYSYIIFNEDAGHWNKEKTIWYSNYSYTDSYHKSYIYDDDDYFYSPYYKKNYTKKSLYICCKCQYKYTGTYKENCHICHSVMENVCDVDSATYICKNKQCKKEYAYRPALNECAYCKSDLYLEYYVGKNYVLVDIPKFKNKLMNYEKQTVKALPATELKTCPSCFSVLTPDERTLQFCRNCGTDIMKVTKHQTKIKGEV